MVRGGEGTPGGATHREARMKPTQVVAVWSGGGAKAIAHAGAWLALDELKFRPQRIAATSMGAVIGACFASGMSYADVVRAALSVTRKEVAALSPVAMIGGVFAKSLLKGDPLRSMISRLVPARSFAELTVPLTVTAVDLDTGDLALFGVGGRSDVPLIDALYASCALPVYYPPLEIQGRRYADGGLRAALPLDAVRGVDADLIVAVDTGPSLGPAPEGAGGRRKPALIASHSAAIRILMAQQTALNLERWRHAGGPRLVVVRPVHERSATFALDRIARYVELGYRSTYQALTR